MYKYISAVPQHCVSRSFNDAAPYQNVFYMHLEGFSWNYFLRHDPSIVKWGRRTENISALTDFVKKLRTWKDGGNLEGENEKNRGYRLSWRWKGREIWVKRRDRLWADSQALRDRIHGTSCCVAQIYDLQISIWYELIYLLTATGLTPGGSSTVQYTFTHKQYTEQHNETEHPDQIIHNNNT